MEKNSNLPSLDQRNFFKLHMKMAKMLGYFPPEYKERRKKICYFIYSVIFLGFNLFLCLLTQFAEIITVFGDIEKMTNASFLTLTHLSQVFKLYPFIRHRSKVRNLIESINREEFKPRNWEQYNILINNIKKAEAITKLQISMCTATCGLWGLFPMLDKDPGEKLRLPLAGRFPFNTDESPAFEIAYVYQTVTSYMNGLGIVSMDMFMMTIIISISAQLGILNNSLQIIRQNPKTPKENSNVDNNLRQILILNVQHYKIIITYAKDVTSVFTNCIMIQFVISVVLTCIILFQLTLIPVLSLYFLSMVLYQACMFVEIFFWCYFGNEIIEKSIQLTQSAYMCEWVSCSKNFRKDLLFFMTRTQMPLELYAGGYFTLSLPTYMAMAKMSWSYFAVLHRLHSVDY